MLYMYMYTYLTPSLPNFLWRHAIYTVIHTIQVMTEADFDGVPDVPLHVINNYFSIGADAQIALLFHNERGIYMYSYIGCYGCSRDDPLPILIMICRSQSWEIGQSIEEQVLLFQGEPFSTATM